MNYIITYDIGESRLRIKIAKFLLKNACERIQKSVYLAPAFRTSEWDHFKQNLYTLFQGQLTLKDSLYIIPIQRNQLIKTIILGSSNPLDTFLTEEYCFFF